MSDDVSDGVSTRFPGRETGIAEEAQQLGSFGKGDMVVLDVFTGCEVALFKWRVYFGNFSEHVHLIGCKTAERNFHPNHLAVGLPLAVNALAEPEPEEFDLVLFAGLEKLYLVFKIGDFGAVDLEDAGVFRIWNPVASTNTFGGQRVEPLFSVSRSLKGNKLPEQTKTPLAWLQAGSNR